MTRDDTRITTNWVTINWMVYGTIANATFFHFTDNGFEGFDVLGWVAIKLNVGDVTSVTKVHDMSFDFNFSKGTDWIVNWNMKAVGIVVAISNTFNVRRILCDRFS